MESIPFEEAVQEWEVIDPQGAINVEPMTLAPRIPALEGKTILLRWNAKPNGDVFASRVAELITEEAKGAKIVKMWEIDPSTAMNPGRTAAPETMSKQIAGKIAKLKPDIVVGVQGD